MQTEHKARKSRRPILEVGLLRIIIAGIAVLCLPLVFFSGAGSAGWGILPSQIAPVIVVLLVWVLPFDMLMARVFMADRAEDERERYRTIIKFDGILMIVLLVFWGPFFFALLF
jgi:hypothetical protein